MLEQINIYACKQLTTDIGHLLNFLKKVLGLELNDRLVLIARFLTTSKEKLQQIKEQERENLDYGFVIHILDKIKE